MTKPCSICLKNGFPDEQVNLEKLGEENGKAKWNVTNPDNSVHKHKGGTFKKSYDEEQLNELKKIAILLERISEQLANGTIHLTKI